MLDVTRIKARKCKDFKQALIKTGWASLVLDSKGKRREHGRMGKGDRRGREYRRISGEGRWEEL
jgi:hypothetical protein